MKRSTEFCRTTDWMTSEIKGFAAIKIPAFRNFLTARFLLTMSFQMQYVAVGWQVYNITGDPLTLGIIGLSEAIPFLSLVLFAGHWADIYVRKKLILLSVLLFALCSLFFLLFSLSPDLLPGNHPEHYFYLTFALAGIARALAGPSIQATLPQILRRELYANGAAWNSSVWQIAAVSGPAAGGLIYGFAGKTETYITVLALCIFSFFFFIKLPQFEPARQRNEAIGQSLAAGLSFVFRKPVILGALSLDLFAVLFGGAVALLPVFANEVLHTGPEGLGILRAAPSLGAVLTALLVTRYAPMRNSGKILLLCVAMFGVCMIGFALSDIFWLSFILLFFSGLFDGVSVLIRSTIIQLFTPDEMRGRVASVNSVFIGSSNEIGAFESGLAARILGLVPSVIAGGSMTLVCTAFMAGKFPSLRNLHLEDHVEDA